MPVTWKTIHRFWPLIPLYGGKVLDRLRRKFFPQRASPGTSLDSPRMRLWQDPAVQQALHPSRLLSTQLLDEGGVTQFLERSKQPEFDFSGQWSNLLSLEMTLQRLKAVKAEN